MVLNSAHLTFPLTGGGSHAATYHTTENACEHFHTHPLMDLCQNAFGICIQEPNCQATVSVHFFFF